MILGNVSINSTYLVLGAVASAIIIGKPVFTVVLGWLRKPGRNRKWDERVDRALWTPIKTRYEPNPPLGALDQMTRLADVVDRLVDRFERHESHPPGADT